MKPFRLYRNLHRNAFSLQSYIKEKRGYRVLLRSKILILMDVKFKIYETGRQKVIKEKRKNVHAYVEPVWFEEVKKDIDVSRFREIYYNPYEFDSFVYKDTLEKVDTAFRVLAYDNKLYDVDKEVI